MYGVLDSFTDYPHGLPIFLFVCLFLCHQIVINKYINNVGLARHEEKCTTIRERM